MTAPTMPGLLCASDGCAGKRCPRAHHAYLGGGPSGREPQYGRCQTHGRCDRFQLDELATLDAPAGLDGSPDRPRGDLPGTDTAPAPGAEAAAPPADGQPAAEVGGPAPAAGQLLGSWISWHCPLHRVWVELPSAHTCKAGLIRARITATKELENG